jgi:ATP-binding cassette subfamily B protein
MDAFKDAILAYSVYYPVVDFFSAVAIASVIWWGGKDVIAKVVASSVSLEFNPHTLISFHTVATAASLGVLIAFTQYAMRFFRPIMDFSEKYNILQSAMAASERIFKMLDTPVDVVSAPVTKKPTGPGRIEFDHVWFAYRDIPEESKDRVATGASPVPPERSPAAPGKSHVDTAASAVLPKQREAPSGNGHVESQPDWVLRDVSFAIEPGETVAVVGHTGAGKTTLISLLLRFYDVQQGAVKIDGVDVKDMDLGDLRARFGVVLQDPFLFTGTIGGNIRLGTQRIQDAHIQQAAEDVNLGDFIRALPNGFDEAVRERGSTLSTGQKQLISFARALAHEPKILILDEATSSVDTETEFKVRDALARMVEGRTSLIIAHRLSTIQRADKIVVMHKGQLREMGTHQELLAHRGIYYKLYQLQYKDQEIADVGRAPSPANAFPEEMFDPKALWLNAEHIRGLAIEDLSQRLLPIVEGAGFRVTPEKMLRITPLIRERIKLLRDVLTAADFFFVDQLPPYDPAELIPQKGDAAMALKVLRRATEVLANVEFKHDPLDQSLRAAAQELGIKAGQMFQPIRVAVCGRKNAPPLFETLEVLGRETTLARIEQAISRIG